MLERHHLNIIRAVIEHGTLTKAAESLYLSQSALSHTIKKLEEQLGAPLWHKEGRNLRLTQAGERLHRAACCRNLTTSKNSSATTRAAKAGCCASAWNATPAISGC